MAGEFSSALYCCQKDCRLKGSSSVSAAFKESSALSKNAGMESKNMKCFAHVATLHNGFASEPLHSLRHGQ